jgi:FlaA1/EpsC-like NDP-sugar epimerase
MFKKIVDDVPMVLVCALAIKMMVTGSSYSDAAALLVLGAYSFAAKYLSENKKITDFEKRLAVIEEDHKKIKTSVDGVKLTMGLRTGNGR